MSIKEKISENISKLASDKKFEDKEIYVFGVNGFTNDIINCLAANNCKLAGILDNAIAKQGSAICEVMVFAPDIVNNKADVSIILIASGYFYEMLRQLEPLGFKVGTNIFQLLPNVNRHQVKAFWEKRAQIDISTLPKLESIVNLSATKESAQIRFDVERECINKHILLNKEDILVDLGAGVGQWSRFLANRVKKVYAVEMVDKLAEIGEKLVFEEGIDNVEFVRQPAECFMPSTPVDCILISGLLLVLDDEQYDSLIENVSKMLKNGGHLFMRETVSTIGVPRIRYSTQEDGFTVFHRTPDMHISKFAQKGFVLNKCGPFYDDSHKIYDTSIANLYYFLFTKR